MLTTALRRAGAPTISTFAAQREEDRPRETLRDAGTADHLRFRSSSVEARELDEEEARLESARRCLAMLRKPETEGRTCFGGRVSIGGVDRGAVLRRYYPVLQIARELAQESDLRPGVERFLPRISLPEDLRDLAKRAVVSDSNVAAAPRAARLEIRRLYQSLVAGESATAEDFALDDARALELARLSRVEGAGIVLDPKLFRALDHEAQVALARVFARAAELGEKVKIGKINAVGWHESRSSAPVLRRLAKATDCPQSFIRFTNGCALNESRYQVIEAAEPIVATPARTKEQPRERVRSISDAVLGAIRAGGAVRTAAKELAAALRASASKEELDRAVEEALEKIHQADLSRVLPLAEADAKLATVPAPSDANGPVRFGRTIEVAGIELGMNDDPNKDVRAVPRKSSAELIMTPTTERNLRRMAAEWRLARPVLLEGPTSAGKTAAVRYLAYVTGSPYRRINLSYHTDVSDLLGRYVGGENRYSKQDLEAKSDTELAALAVEYGLDEGLDRAAHIAQILDAQHNPRWVDGPVVSAMKKGEVLLLDEINLARPEVIERLNSLFDDDKNLVLTEHRNEIVRPHPSFRIFATMNPASYAGRARLSEAMRSRWTTLICQGLTQRDLTAILKAKYGATIPAAELAKLVASHDALSRAADEGEIGRASGGLAFSLRNLFRVCERFIRYRGGALDDAALMRRETEEIYRGGLFDPDDLASVDDLLATAMPYRGPGFYDDLSIEETKDSFTIGDVTLAKLDTGHALVPGSSSRLVLTRRTKEVLYRLAKAIDCGENVALIGERASGKTAVAKMLAHLVGQPYYRQLISASTDTMQLVGGYDDRGWKDGLLLEAGRPDGTPGILLLDELNLGGSALLERLNPVLDDERKVVLAEKEGEEIILHPSFRFVAAMNPPTKGYGGRQKLSKALQNRLTTIYVPSLADREEQLEIVRARAVEKEVPEPIADALVELHHRIAEGYEKGLLGRSLREIDRPVLSIRQLMSALDLVAELKADHGALDAFRIAAEVVYGSTPDEADLKAVQEMAEEVAR